MNKTWVNLFPFIWIFFMVLVLYIMFLIIKWWLSLIYLVIKEAPAGTVVKQYTLFHSNLNVACLMCLWPSCGDSRIFLYSKTKLSPRKCPQKQVIQFKNTTENLENSPQRDTVRGDGSSLTVLFYFSNVLYTVKVYNTALNTPQNKPMLYKIKPEKK